jgi:3-hydroxyacyl-CoA dehydrogenase
MTPPGALPSPICIVGAGTIGASLTALLVANGVEVRLYDSRPDAGRFLEALVEGAMPDLESLGVGAGRPRAAYECSATLAEACAGVSLVFEAIAERLEAKQALFREIEAVSGPQTVIASTTSSFLPSQLQAGMRHPGRLLVAHPFNPPHLIPLVEIVGSPATEESAVQLVFDFFASLGRKPVRLQREAVGHLANRLTSALYREAVSLVAEGIGSVQDVDDAIRYGPGLRWAAMGPHMIYHLAAGDGGYRQYLEHLGPTQEARWRHLKTPALTPDLRERLAAGVERAAAGASLQELRTRRDRALVLLMKALADADPVYPLTDPTKGPAGTRS